MGVGYSQGPAEVSCWRGYLCPSVVAVILIFLPVIFPLGLPGAGHQGAHDGRGGLQGSWVQRAGRLSLSPSHPNHL